ncbi:methyltransferase domain-containing protein [Pseudomonas abietaniphila]|uniref:class I SAM-dependent methyltransferase n=1 Tax=Pseudomonas abietaniphila TaxID=89065 RepID=UPI003216C464
MDSWATRQGLVGDLYKLFKNKKSDSEIAEIVSSFSFLDRDIDLLTVLLLSKEGFDSVSQGTMDTHLYLMHNARLKMVKHLLPPGDIILDLGGANAPLHHMGYRHDYSKIVLIDLPTEERHKDFQVVLQDTGGKVVLRYEDMTDLKGIKSASVDLVWSGQSIEHVTPVQGQSMCREAFRVLKSGGRFCLDTPNGHISSIHAATVGNTFIHPDHKIEYTPDQLRGLLVETGFHIAEEWGICEMPMTKKTGVFSYDDFLLGGAITKNINDAYIQFFNCIKP